jgi:hypothetical protein
MADTATPPILRPFAARLEVLLQIGGRQTALLAAVVGSAAETRLRQSRVAELVKVRITETHDFSYPNRVLG